MKVNSRNGAERIVKSSINWDAAGTTLLNFLAGRFTYRGAEDWKKLILDGTVTCNDQKVSPDKLLAVGDVVEYRPGELVEPPAELSYQILYEDRDLVVIDKPGNLCVHPAGPFFKHTLWYLLREKYGESLHFVTRLDRETSGAMIVALRPEIAAKLERAEMEKSYLVLVHGDFPETLTAEGFLFHDPVSVIRKKRRYAATAPENVKSERCLTVFRKISGDGKFSLLEATLGTGRMHQIRATLSSLGYPVVGDKLYGLDENFYLRQKHDALTEADRAALILPRQALHAWKLAFRHPVNGEKIVCTAPEPGFFAKMI